MTFQTQSCSYYFQRRLYQQITHETNSRQLKPNFKLKIKSKASELEPTMLLTQNQHSGQNETNETLIRHSNHRMFIKVDYTTLKATENHKLI